MNRNQISASQQQYIESVFVSEDEALAAIKNTLRGDEARMQINPVEGKTLHTLAKMIGAKTIIELGCLAGYSAVWLARSLPESGRLYTIEMDYTKLPRIKEHLDKCGVADKVTLLNGKALEVLPAIEEHAPFDMIFIDADKANYINYLDWAEKNIRKGGLIVGDNTFLFGAVYGDNPRGMKPQTIAIMQEFNKRLANSDKYTSIILPTAEGMTVAVKNF